MELGLNEMLRLLYRGGGKKSNFAHESEKTHFYRWLTTCIRDNKVWNFGPFAF